MRARRGGYNRDARCRVCKTDFPEDTGVRARPWAFGFAGVRWIVCSKACAIAMEKDVALAS